MGIVVAPQGSSGCFDPIGPVPPRHFRCVEPIKRGCRRQNRGSLVGLMVSHARKPAIEVFARRYGFR
jgi:hypothetical protein